MRQNAYLLEKIDADTAENERNLPKIGKIFGKFRHPPRTSTTAARTWLFHAGRGEVRAASKQRRSHLILSSRRSAALTIAKIELAF